MKRTRYPSEVKTETCTASPRAFDELREALRPYVPAGVVVQSEQGRLGLRVSVSYPDEVADRVRQIVREWYVDYVW